VDPFLRSRWRRRTIGRAATGPVHPCEAGGAEALRLIVDGSDQDFRGCIEEERKHSWRRPMRDTKTLIHHAATAWYSWIRPPRRSRRLISGTIVTGSMFPSPTGAGPLRGALAGVSPSWNPPVIWDIQEQAPERAVPMWGTIHDATHPPYLQG
jgi:hypothetical protein